MNRAFWENKRVFITGHTGFKGAWLSLWLQIQGAVVAGYSLDNMGETSMFYAARIGKGMENYFGDINDFNKLKEAIDLFEPDIIFHLAAQSLVQNSYIDPIQNFQTNIMGTVNVLEAARNNKSVKLVVNVTSDKCYYNDGFSIKSFTENDPMGGYDPYSASKGCSELITQSYRYSYFLDANKQLATVRAGNVIGGGDWAENRIIPDIIKASTTGDKLVVRNRHAIRPWQYVLEPLNGYMLLAEKLWGNEQYAQGWNFGPDEKGMVSVERLARLAEQYIPFNVVYQQEDANYYEAKILMLNSTKARNELGWGPKLNVEEAVEWTMNWYSAFQKGSDMHNYSKNQINDFEEMKGSVI